MSTNQEITQQLRQKARELLEAKSVECVIGYERASDGAGARPYFAYSPADCDRLIFDETCTHNLVRYLRDKRGKKVAVTVKPCDARAINVLLLEKQQERGNVTILGIACPGVVETRWGSVQEQPQPRCRVCTGRTPAVYDVLIGEPPASVKAEPPYAEVNELEALSPAERQKFWDEQADFCLRCYACRQVCAGCYCSECFVEQLDPRWVGIRIDQESNNMWHLGRAFHLAGRCAGCDECQRVCPLHIPLRLLNRRMEKETQELFSFKAGEDSQAAPPFATYKKDEHLGVGD